MIAATRTPARIASPPRRGTGDSCRSRSRGMSIAPTPHREPSGERRRDQRDDGRDRERPRPPRTRSSDGQRKQWARLTACTPITDTTTSAPATPAGWRSRSPSTWRCWRPRSPAGSLFDSVALLADAGHVLSDIGAIGARDRGRVGGFAPRPRPAHVRAPARRDLRRARERHPAHRRGRVGVHRGDRPPVRRPRGRRRRGRGGRRVRPDRQRASRRSCSPRGDRDDLNLEGVLRHSAADALGSLGALVAGLVIVAGGPGRGGRRSRRS